MLHPMRKSSPSFLSLKSRSAALTTINSPYIIEQGEKAAEEQILYLRRLLVET